MGVDVAGGRARAGGGDLPAAHRGAGPRRRRRRPARTRRCRRRPRSSPTCRRAVDDVLLRALEPDPRGPLARTWCRSSPRCAHAMPDRPEPRDREARRCGRCRGRRRVRRPRGAASAPLAAPLLVFVAAFGVGVRRDHAAWRVRAVILTDEPRHPCGPPEQRPLNHRRAPTTRTDDHPCLEASPRRRLRARLRARAGRLRNDPATGLRAIIAIHSTALGPALGGTRFYPYASTADALADVLNLSRGMSYKAALAGLDLGGGKAVIIGDPATLKSEALLRAYGRFVQSLGGRYYTACDVGTFSDGHGRHRPRVLLRHRPHRRPRRRRRQLGAHGVRRVPGHARRRRGRPGAATSLAGRTVGVAGVGKVGRHLVRHLVEDGATVVVTDVLPAGGRRGSATSTPTVASVESDRRAGRARRSTSTPRARSAAR